MLTEDIAPIVQADERRRAAVNANDADALAPLFAEDLIYIHSSGRAETRDAYLARVRSGQGRYGNLVVSNFTVRRKGATAICDGDVRFEYAKPDKPTKVIEAHFLAIWREEAGAWRLAGYASPSTVGAPGGRELKS
jgi:ketosteroid isomerase-like protein